MLNDEWSPRDNPVVVLSCVPDNHSSRLSCIDIVRNLELHKLTRPWQVCIQFSENYSQQIGMILLSVFHLPQSFVPYSR